MQKEILIYTTIFHAARMRLGITVVEYTIADSIYHLSGNPSNATMGWCTMSKDNIGAMMGLTRRGVQGIIQRLEKKAIIERHPETHFLRTTQKWYQTIIISRNAVNARRQEKERARAVFIGREAKKIGMKW